MKQRFNELASRDVRSITHFYAQERRSLAVSFVEELYGSVLLLIANPQLGQRISKNYRRLLLPRFPYMLIYRIEQETDLIRIIAVCHQRRRPGYWTNRVEEPAPLYEVLSAAA